MVAVGLAFSIKWGWGAVTLEESPAPPCGVRSIAAGGLRRGRDVPKPPASAGGYGLGGFSGVIGSFADVICNVCRRQLRPFQEIICDRCPDEPLAAAPDDR